MFVCTFTRLKIIMVLVATLLSCMSFANTADLLDVKVLFLGDNGHHTPSERAAELIPAMADRGISITYTDRVEDLNRETLGRYDALIIYANIDKIDPEHAQALIDYVESGGGFVPLHCASWCFQNSPEYIALVGGQFARHGTGDFVADIVDREHPVTERMLEFSTWDETYVHGKLGEDRHVLMERRDDEGDEPYTWTRTQGKGRVFYTAYGHDTRTFTHPGFLELVERGIRWSADKIPTVTKEPFQYEEAKIAFYPPKDAPGIVQEAPTKMQLPLSPSESVKHTRLPPGFDASLYVAEPDIIKVIAMNWDARGRLWVAETVDYPNDMQVPEKGKDRIKICEDTDGDGRADKFTIYADKLSIPTSLIHANGGLIVAQAPDTLFLKDTDGDDVADERSVLFSGWGTADTHSGPSSFRLGLDNWVWGTVGYSGFTGTVGGKDHNFRMGVIRFKPDGSALEFVAATNNNTWGLGLTETGEVFASTANGNHSDYVPIPNRYYESVRGYSGTSGAHLIFDHKKIHPITPNVRQVDWHEQFTAASGSAIYTARHYPEFYWNRVAFVTEPTGHLVHQCILEEEGSSYVSRDGWNFMASVDEWSSPVVAEVGPDGNVWLSDWYNYIVQHNPTPSGFENGPGNAYVTPLRDKKHGRVYRVVYGEDEGSTSLDLGDTTENNLLAALKHPNMFWRTTAQRIIVEEQRIAMIPMLQRLIADKALDTIGNAPGALHALGALEGLECFSKDDRAAQELLRSAMTHPAPAVRRLAAQFAASVNGFGADIAALLNDDDPKVRLTALLALSEVDADESVGAAIATVLDEKKNRNDPWIAAAAMVAAAQHDVGFLLAAAESKDHNADMVKTVANHYARGPSYEQLDALLRTLGSGNKQVHSAWLAGLAEGWPSDAPPFDKEKTKQALGTIADDLGDDDLLAVVALAKKWDMSGEFDARLDAIVAKYAGTLSDETAKSSHRVNAAQKLVDLRPGRTTRARILDEITPSVALALSDGLIQALGNDPAPSTAKDLLARFDSFMPSARKQAIDVLLTRPGWSIQFVFAIQKEKITRPNFSVIQKSTLLDAKDEQLKELANRVLATAGHVDSSREEIVEKLMPLTRKQGDIEIGKQAFQENCVQCHTFNGEGGTIAPDLTGIAGGNREEILIAIVDPNRSVEGNFRQWTVWTTDGEIVSGLLTDETQTAFTIHDALGNAHSILREDVEKLSMSEQSVMPEGFEEMPEAMLVGLLEYLTTVGEYAPLSLRGVANTVSTVPMFHDGAPSENYNEQLIFEQWGTQVFDGIPYYVLDPKGGTLPNLIMLNSPHSDRVKKKPGTVSIPCGRKARAIHLLSGVSGWGYPGGTVGSVSMIVRLQYGDGKSEDHALKNGIHFSDYIRVVDVPESKLAFELGSRQLRQLSIFPKRDAVIDSIEFVKGDDASAPMVIAVTVETEHE